MTQLLMFPRAVKRRSLTGRAFSRLAEAVRHVAVELAAAWCHARNRPASKKPRHATRPMLLDLYDCCWRALYDKHATRFIAKSNYMARLGKGSQDARERRWSTFRALLRFSGVPHEQAQDEAGVVLTDPAGTLAMVEALLPPVGPLSESEEKAHESARFDSEVWIGLDVVRRYGWSGVEGISGVRRMVAALEES